jgi:hypothetical protein
MGVTMPTIGDRTGIETTKSIHTFFGASYLPNKKHFYAASGSVMFLFQNEPWLLSAFH